METAALDKTLKLVITRTREEDGSPYYVFASPLSLRAAKTYWRVFQDAAGMVYTSDLGAKSAPRFAADAIRSAARQLGIEAAVEKDIISEIQRLAMVITPASTGWNSVPYDVAVKSGAISEDEADEVLNVLAFFTLALRFHSTNGGERTALINGALGFHWNGRTTSSSFLEWQGSLPTWTPDENSGATTTDAPQTMQNPQPDQAPGGVRTILGSQVPS